MTGTKSTSDSLPAGRARNAHDGECREGETPIYEQHFPHLESLTSASLCGWPCGKEFFQWLLDVYMGFRVQAEFSRQRESSKVRENMIYVILLE